MSSAAVVTPPATNFATLDELLLRVTEGSRVFAKLSIDERIQLAEEMRAGYREIAEESVVAACRAKDFDPDSAVAGEEWLSGPMVTIRNIRLTAQGLRDIKAYGAPRVGPSWLRTLPDGRLAVKVYPTTKLDGVLLPKHVAEDYMAPGVTAQNLREHQAAFYRSPHHGRVCLVLGGGNVNAIPPTDVVYKMFVEGTVCILKMNPVNAYLGPFLERAFRTAIQRGFFAVTYGGADEGAYMVTHALVDEVHITGSDRTYDMMVWGPPGPEREDRKRRNDPVLKKTITSELGNISPVIVVPGPYSDAELEFQGRNIAGMVANNASFNCNSAKLMITQKEWPGRAALMDRVERGLGEGVVRSAYYPGAEERFKQFTDGRRGLKPIGNAGPGQLPYALIPDVDPSKIDDRVFTQEPWCSLLSETGFAASDPAAYVRQAVKFVNENLWGTLCATLIVHPETMKDPAMASVIEEAIRDLKYGTVCVNTWPAAVFGIATTPWGAHPTSSTPQDIQSGSGWVHNTFMFDSLEKCVFRGPVKGFPISPWFPGHKTIRQLARALVDYEMNPGWGKIPSIAMLAMRG